MACHLAHKIPWDAVSELYVAPKTHDHTKRIKRISHAAHSFGRALYEFQRTDRTSECDRAFYDPSEWDTCVFADGGELMEFQDSLVWGYIELNLILADPKRVLPRMMRDGELPRALRVLAGEASGAHPDVIACRLREAFDGNRLRPLSANVMTILRDHAALMFRCMYTGARGHDLLYYEEMATAQFLRFFGYPVSTQ